ncbi:hypothetical protein RRG08_065784 [Elysia crispata]|uniref:Uncharacterized protein n=1 Tax=Elysia crispata TaxID=231223 RepID=A0AAE0ZRC3_9GAST|nr:hypothetical protein RRG08_065784 [Elysia crispata]
MDGQMVKSLADSLFSREEEERHQRNLNEDEQLKNQVAEAQVMGVTYQTSSDESGKQVNCFGAPRSISSGTSLEQLDPGQLIQLKKLIPTVIAGEATPTSQTVVLDLYAQCVFLE